MVVLWRFGRLSLVNGESQAAPDATAGILAVAVRVQAAVREGIREVDATSGVSVRCRGRRWYLARVLGRATAAAFKLCYGVRGTTVIRG